MNIYVASSYRKYLEVDSITASARICGHTISDNPDLTIYIGGYLCLSKPYILLDPSSRCEWCDSKHSIDGGCYSDCKLCNDNVLADSCSKECVGIVTTNSSVSTYGAKNLYYGPPVHPMVMYNKYLMGNISRCRTSYLYVGPHDEKSIEYSNRYARKQDRNLVVMPEYCSITDRASYYMTYDDTIYVSPYEDNVCTYAMESLLYRCTLITTCNARVCTDDRVTKRCNTSTYRYTDMYALFYRVSQDRDRLLTYITDTQIKFWEELSELL